MTLRAGQSFGRVGCALVIASIAAIPRDAGELVDASLTVDGELLEAFFPDVDGDGNPEVCVVVRDERGERHVRVHEIRGTRVPTTPTHEVRMLEDVVAFGFCELRPDPGLELFLLTKSGAFSYSLAKSGYRDNVERLVSADLLYDMPDPRRLPRWEYVLPRAGDALDWLLLPTRRGSTIWGPATDAPEDPKAPRYELRADFSTDEDDVIVPMRAVQRRAQHADLRIDQSGARLRLANASGPGPFLGDDDPPVLLEDERSYRAPALVDADGDGDLDLISWGQEGLAVHLGGPAGFSAEPDRVEALPEYLRPSGQNLRLELTDIDGDGAADVMARLEKRGGTFENSTFTVLSLINDGKRLLPERPPTPRRFEAAEAIARSIDVDGDGKRDLVVRKFELPSMLGSASGLRFTLHYLVFEGKGGGRFEKRPMVQAQEEFSEDTVSRALATRRMDHDVDGDGAADLVEIDLQGRIAVRRMVNKGGVFGARWELDPSHRPWRRFEVPGSFGRLTVEDVNGDGLGDIASPSREDGVLVLLLTTGGKR